MTKQIKGVLGTKLGMTQVFDDGGEMGPVTVVAAGPCVFTAGPRPSPHGRQPGPASGRPRPRAAADQGRGGRAGRRAGPGPQRRQVPGSSREPLGGDTMTATVNVVSPSGSSGAIAELPAEIFDAKVNVPLIHQVVVAQQAAARQGTHATKGRGAVRGGGKKPYRQKGTGRARQGSIRAPQFTGGGGVHGSVPRSYEQRTPKKMKTAT